MAFTIIELLLVVAIVGVLGTIGAATYVDWRAGALSRDATAAVERAVADARQEAKRLSVAAELVFDVDDGFSVTVGDVERQVALPHGATVSGADVIVGFDGPLVVQTPYAAVSVTLVTGSGVLQRNAIVTIIPPLGRTSVVVQ